MGLMLKIHRQWISKNSLGMKKLWYFFSLFIEIWIVVLCLRKTYIICFRFVSVLWRFKNDLLNPTMTLSTWPYIYHPHCLSQLETTPLDLRARSLTYTYKKVLTFRHNAVQTWILYLHVHHKLRNGLLA